MASSQNLASLDSWSFRSPFAVDSWFSDAFSRENETLARALQQSISKPISSTPTTAVAATVDKVGGGATSDSLVSPLFSSINNSPDPAAAAAAATHQAPTPTLSGVSGGSDPEPAPTRTRNPIPPAGGKISKRKSRASKKTQTTYITADAANFRQMVQQVTGAKYLPGHLSASPILKPEPQRPGAGGATRLPIGAACLPTLDTSAFLLDHHQQAASTVPTGGFGNASTSTGGSMQLTYASVAVGEGGGGACADGGLDFDALPSFPTLESSVGRAVQSGYVTF